LPSISASLVRMLIRVGCSSSGWSEVRRTTCSFGKPACSTRALESAVASLAA
jgi:hypothetical protein